MTKEIHPLHQKSREVLAEERKRNPGTLTARALAANSLCLFFADLKAVRESRPGAWREDAMDRLCTTLANVVKRAPTEDAVVCLSQFYDVLAELLDSAKDQQLH